MKTIDLSKQKLENEKEELATIIENQTKISRTLQNTKKMRESFIEKLSDEEKTLQSKIDEINTKINPGAWIGNILVSNATKSQIFNAYNIFQVAL